MGGRAKDGTPVVGGGGGVRGHVVRGWSEEGWLGGFQRGSGTVLSRLSFLHLPIFFGRCEPACGRRKVVPE